MRRPTTRRLKFQDAVDTVDPDVFHHTVLDFSKPYVEGRHILDVGCWVGNYASLVENVSRRVIGIDTESIALSVAASACTSTVFVNGSILEAPFADGTFEVVCMWEVLEHLPSGSEPEALREINRILKRGGYLLLSTPHRQWVANVLDPAYWIASHRHYNQRDLKLLLASSGFRVEKLVVRSGVVCLLYGLAFYVFKHIFRRKVPQVGWLDRVRKKEFERDGFATIFVVTRKELAVSGNW